MKTIPLALIILCSLSAGFVIGRQVYREEPRDRWTTKVFVDKVTVNGTKLVLVTNYPGMMWYLNGVWYTDGTPELVSKAVHGASIGEEIFIREGVYREVKSKP